MDNPTNYLANLNELIPEYAEESIISRTVHSSGDYKAVLFRFAAGQELSEHTAARPAVLLILEGQTDLTLGDDKSDAGPGTYVYMPANLPHSIFAQTDVLMLLELLPEGEQEDG